MNFACHSNITETNEIIFNKMDQSSKIYFYPAKQYLNYYITFSNTFNDEVIQRSK